MSEKNIAPDHEGFISYSPFESEYFQLRIFRNKSSELPDSEHLKNICREQSADLLRLKLNVSDEERITQTLFDTGFPFYYSHSVMTVYANYQNADIPGYKNEKLLFEKYSGEQKTRFYNLIIHGMGENPIGYFKTPLINKLITKEKEAACYAEYYSGLYDGTDPKKIAFIMNKEGTDAGVFVFEMEGEDTIHTSMAAVLPHFRSSGLFHDMKVFRQRYCLERGIHHAYAGFRLNNFHTPNSLLKIGYKIIRAEHIYHLPVLLNKRA